MMDELTQSVIELRYALSKRNQIRFKESQCYNTRNGQCSTYHTNAADFNNVWSNFVIPD